MKYPIDYDSFMAADEEKEGKASENVKDFAKEMINIINNAYYQGRLDESLRGGDS